MKLQTINKNCSGCGTCKLICSLSNFKKAGPSRALLNIEGRFPEPGDYIIHVCDQCGVCAEVCPVDAISEKNGIFFIDPDECIGCYVCVDECPQKVMIKLEEDNIPAKCISCGECVEICPRNALSFAKEVQDTGEIK